METNTLDGGQIAILAIAALMAGMALRTWLRGTKSKTAPEPELLVQIRNELREANGSLTRLKSTVAQQQVALDATRQDIAAMRRSAEDHAGDMKSAIENVSAAIDAGRAETNTRHEAMSNRLDEIGAATADAKDNTAAILESVGGLRGRMDTISEQARAIPPLADRIDHLQRNVASIAEAASKPKPTTPARARKTATNSRRGKGKRAGRTADAPPNRGGDESPAGETTPPPDEPQLAETGGADAGDATTPPKQSQTAAEAPEAKPVEPATPADDDATDDQGPEGSAAAGSTSSANGRPAPATPPAAENQATAAENQATEAGEPAERGDAADTAGNHTADAGAGLSAAADDTNAPRAAADAPDDGEQNEATG